MKTPISKIESATAGKHEVRYYLKNAWLDVEKKRLIATDGHICAIVPAELEEGDITGPITSEALKNARASKSKSIEAKGSLVLDNSASYPREPGIKYPDVDRIRPTEEFKIVISLDAALLLRLAEAINDPEKNYRKSQVVTLHISGPESTVQVTGNNPDAVGMIMPIRIKS